MTLSSETLSSDLHLGRRVMALIEELARHTDEPGRITRLYLSRPTARPPTRPSP